MIYMFEIKLVKNRKLPTDKVWWQNKFSIDKDYMLYEITVFHHTAGWFGLSISKNTKICNVQLFILNRFLSIFFVKKVVIFCLEKFDAHVVVSVFADDILGLVIMKLSGMRKSVLLPAFGKDNNIIKNVCLFQSKHINIKTQ